MEKVKKTASNLQESLDLGFFGETNSYPNEFHEASGTAEAQRAAVFGVPAAGNNVVTMPEVVETDKGAVVNGPNKNAPKSSGGTSGRGANTDTAKDDK